MSNRGMLEIIQANDFFAEGDAERYAAIAHTLPFTEKPYGLEVEDFNMILENAEPIMSRVLGERVIIDHKKSGLFRKPMNDIIHFEEFHSGDEWCFVVALERNTLNLYHHSSGVKNASQDWRFNYMDLFQWNLHTNILLEPNQGVFFRPWVFHSLDRGLVQYYRLIADKKFRVLVLGNSERRSQVARDLANKVENSRLIISAEARVDQKDVDYSKDGQNRHAYRLLTMARESKKECVIIDSKCPHQFMRDIINPDVIIWINDDQSTEEFEKPVWYDNKYNTVTDDIIDDIIEKIQTKKV